MQAGRPERTTAYLHVLPPNVARPAKRLRQSLLGSEAPGQRHGAVRAALRQLPLFPRRQDPNPEPLAEALERTLHAGDRGHVDAESDHHLSARTTIRRIGAQDPTSGASARLRSPLENHALRDPDP